MFKKSIAVICIYSIILFSLSACTSLRTFEKYEYRQLEYRLLAVGLEPEEPKKPGLAGALNIGPGIGNAYLGQWGPFIGNVLLWPYSILWGIPQAIRDARIINQKETLYFYKFGPGKEELKRLEEEKGITEEQLEEIKRKAQEDVR